MLFMKKLYFISNILFKKDTVYFAAITLVIVLALLLLLLLACFFDVSDTLCNTSVTLSMSLDVHPRSDSTEVHGIGLVSSDYASISY